jgi:phosphoribosylformylglycinamidine (FGAM) synthase-like enzyme
VALAEMAMASGIGARLTAAPVGLPAHGFWFGEDQARYVVTVRERDADDVARRAQAAGVPLRLLGHSGGAALSISGERPILVVELSERFENWLPAYMSGANP